MNSAGAVWGRSSLVLVMAVLVALGHPAAASGVEVDPPVVAVRDRFDAAVLEQSSAEWEVAETTGALDQLRSTAQETRAVVDELDGRIDALGARADRAFQRHEETRRSYVDAAVAAYVAGVPDAVQLRASLMSDSEDRARSLALAESVGDVFAERAAAFRQTGDSLSGALRSLAEERVAVGSAADAAAADLERGERARDEAVTRLAAADEELTAAQEALEQARERIAAAAERFRLGEIDRSELLAMADPRVAVYDISVRAYDAYVTAARTVDAEQPGCRISWWAVAAIGKIESGHGTFGGAIILPNGDVAPRILGVPLTGGAFAVVRDTDGGRWDGDIEWDRAVGPMQFIPSTWRAWATDGNGDGVADPHNFYDAATAAARYLCRGARGQRLDTEAGLRSAAFSYNRSKRYVDEVVATAARHGGLTQPE